MKDFPHPPARKLNGLHAPCYLTAFLLVFTSACSSISSRIHDHSDEFNSYPAPIQSKIQDGLIDLGFTEEMVYLSKGSPPKRRR